MKLEVVCQLIDYYFDPDLQRAIDQQFIPGIEYLLTFMRPTEEHILAGRNNIAILKLFLPYASDDIKYQIFLHHILHTQKLPEIQLLVEHGVDVTQQDNRAIKEVFKYGSSLELAKYLISRGADIMHEGSSNAAVYYAIKCDHLPFIKYVIENGIDIGTYSYIAITAIKAGNLSILQYLLGDRQFTPDDTYMLSFAAMKGQLAIVKFLCDRGIDIEHRRSVAASPWVKPDVVAILLGN